MIYVTRHLQHASLRDPSKILILYSSWRIQQNSFMDDANDFSPSIFRPYFKELAFTGFRQEIQLTLWSSFKFSYLLHSYIKCFKRFFCASLFAYCFYFLYTVSDNSSLKSILRKPRYHPFSRHLLQWLFHYLKPKSWLSVLYRYILSQKVYFYQILNCPKSSLKCASAMFASV